MRNKQNIMSNTENKGLKIQVLNEVLVHKMIRLLAGGNSNIEVSRYISRYHPHLPGSLRSIELHLKEIKSRNNCKTTAQLMFKCGAEFELKINQ